MDCLVLRGNEYKRTYFARFSTKELFVLFKLKTKPESVRLSCSKLKAEPESVVYLARTRGCLVSFVSSRKFLFWLKVEEVGSLAEQAAACSLYEIWGLTQGRGTFSTKSVGG